MREKKTKRTLQAEQTRKRILLCALDLFEKKGFDEVTMLEIAEASQTSIGSIYRYFKSKDEIAAQNMEPLDDIYEHFFEELETSEKYRNFKAIEKLEIFFNFVQKTVCNYENLRSLYIYCLKNPENVSIAMSNERKLYYNYRILLNECKKEGSVRDSISDDECIDLLLQSSRGVIIDWLFRNKNFDFEEQTKRWYSIISNFIQK